MWKRFFRLSGLSLWWNTGSRRFLSIVVNCVSIYLQMVLRPSSLVIMASTSMFSYLSLAPSDFSLRGLFLVVSFNGSFGLFSQG